VTVALTYGLDFLSIEEEGDERLPMSARIEAPQQ